MTLSDFNSLPDNIRRALNDSGLVVGCEHWSRLSENQLSVILERGLTIPAANLHILTSHICFIGIGGFSHAQIALIFSTKVD